MSVAAALYNPSRITIWVVQNVVEELLEFAELLIRRSGSSFCRRGRRAAFAETG